MVDGSPTRRFSPPKKSQSVRNLHFFQFDTWNLVVCEVPRSLTAATTRHRPATLRVLKLFLLLWAFPCRPSDPT